MWRQSWGSWRSRTQGCCREYWQSAAACGALSCWIIAARKEPERPRKIAEMKRRVLIIAAIEAPHIASNLLVRIKRQRNLSATTEHLWKCNKVSLQPPDGCESREHQLLSMLLIKRCWKSLCSYQVTWTRLTYFSQHFGNSLVNKTMGFIFLGLFIPFPDTFQSVKYSLKKIQNSVMRHSVTKWDAYWSSSRTMSALPEWILIYL